jgi:hypothetical protein
LGIAARLGHRVVRYADLSALHRVARNWKIHGAAAARKASGAERWANALVVWVDADEVFDLAAPIDVPDVVLAIMAACERRLLEAEGHSRRFDVCRTVEGQLNRFMRESCDELAVMHDRAAKLGHAGLVVIVDSLEKLCGTSSSQNQVLATAELVFAQEGALFGLPIHVIFTIPPALAIREGFTAVSLMPMIELWQADGRRSQAGYDAARQLLLQRVPMDDLIALFGSKVYERIECLIEWSGGQPRELVRLLQESLLSASMPVLDRDFRRLLGAVGDEYRRLIPADAFSWLARVAVDRYLTFDTRLQRRLGGSMLSNGVVLPYLDEHDWFDLHPAVRRIPGVAAAIAQLESSTPR